jgi:hypothetical protein
MGILEAFWFKWPRVIGWFALSNSVTSGVIRARTSTWDYGYWLNRCLGGAVRDGGAVALQTATPSPHIPVGSTAILHILSVPERSCRLAMCRSLSLARTLCVPRLARAPGTWSSRLSFSLHPIGVSTCIFSVPVRQNTARRPSRRHGGRERGADVVASQFQC